MPGESAKAYPRVRVIQVGGATTTQLNSGLLPPRDVTGPYHLFVSRGPAAHHITKGLSILLAGALSFAVLAATPKPSVRLADPQFSISDCEPSTMTRTVNSVFTLTNQGGAAGLVTVHLNIDGSSAAAEDFGVPSGASSQHDLSATVPDCGTHLYTLRMCTPPASRASSC